ncbi:MAG: ABC transporter substrate-binding protein [Alphaproteobacteria bacterium]|nr:ABC transporter substrate-binding protein [Alphaproteobacteria bacterium]
MNALIRLALLGAAALSLAGGAQAQGGKTLRVVMHSDIKIFDPVWTTAYIVRDHGYMVYDTLFAPDDKLDPKPQMVETWSLSPDRLTYTFTLREGLAFHDGAKVTTADVLASLKRWSAVDTIGKRLAAHTQAWEAVDERTFKLVLKEPFGLVLKGLSKTSSVVPFIMPKAVAETPVGEQIVSRIGSGPFIFKVDEWQPGAKAVYVRNPNYRPRNEPPSGLAGGKVAKLDRIEWLAIPDSQTAINALLAGEIDMIEQVQHDLLPLVEGKRDIEVRVPDKFGNLFLFRFNALHPPFDNPRIRRAAIVAFNQEDFLKASIGNPAYYKACRALFICGTTLESLAGMEGLLESRHEDARRLLREAGYDGTPVVLLHSTDLPTLTNLAPVAKMHLERAGFKVDMQSMDWQSLVARRAKKDAPDKGGWNAFMTSAAAVLLVDPAHNHYTEATGERAFFGWPKDEPLEALRGQFMRESDPARQRVIADQVQTRVMEIGTVAHLGQFVNAQARRRNVTGGMDAPVTVFWNLEKK